MPESRTDEDAPRTLVFVDILGFAALTEQYPTRVQRSESGSYVTTSITELQSRINRFNTVLNFIEFEASMSGGVEIMAFSDCAFLVFDNSLRAALEAAEMMRSCITAGVPVRMGLGKGTFYDLEYAMRNSGSVSVHKSRFVGTAVVRAHKAEQCGVKGMRILLHPSVEEDSSLIRQRVKIIPLPKSFKDAKWELDYLHESRPKPELEKLDADDRALFARVAGLKNPEEPRHVQKHYAQTLAAMNRMRRANNRKLIDLRKLKYATSSNTS